MNYSSRETFASDCLERLAVVIVDNKNYFFITITVTKQTHSLPGGKKKKSKNLNGHK